MGSVLAETLGRQLLHSDIWFLADKCANLVKRIHEPLERSVAVLDDILTLEDDDTSRTVSAAAAAEQVNNNQWNTGGHPEGALVNRELDMENNVANDYLNRQFLGE